jgi:flavodoxin
VYGDWDQKESAEMKVLVTYESRGGRTLTAAEAIAEAIRAAGHTVAVKPLAEVARDDLLDQDLLFAGTWVEGFFLFGVGPARAALQLLKALPPLGGKSAAVFCTYAFNPRGTLGVLRALLEANGARVVGQKAFNRRHPGQGADVFVRGVLGAATPK